MPTTLVRGLCVLLFALFATLSAGGCDKYAQDKEDIRAAYDAYKSAVVTRNASAYRAAVSQGVIEYCDRLLRLARTASRNDTLALPPADRVSVAIVRAGCTRKQIDGFTGATLLDHMVQQGWWSDAKQSDELEAIKVTRSTARGVVKEEGYEPYEVGFVKEDSGWKVDAGDGNAQFNRLFRRYVAKEGLNEVRVVEEMAAEVLGRRVDQRVWDPPQ